MPSVRTACTLHCSNRCSLLAERTADGSVRIRGNPDHPFTAGIICAKTARFAERIASPERIVTPMIRDKTSGGPLREATWDEALDLVAERIGALRPTPGDILHVHGHASFGLLYNASIRLFDLLGAAETSGDMCQGAGATALRQVFGAMVDPDHPDLAKARRIVNWGNNHAAQSPHIGHIVNQARATGTRVLALTPDATDLAAFADEHVVVRPGMDRFLAAAAARLLHDEGRLDAEALGRAANAEAFLALLRGLDVGAACEAAGVSVAQARQVAEAYADGPAASLLGRGLQRYAFGGENTAFIAALAVVTGNVGRVGGGVYFSSDDRGLLAKSFCRRSHPAPRTFSVADLGGDLGRAREAGRPVRLIWVEGTNIVTQGQDSRAIREELMRAFTVVVEPFPTDTTDCADVVLPPTLMLECEDVVAGSRHEWLHWAAKVVEPRGQARSNFEIAAALAARLDLVFPDAEEVLREALHAPGMNADLDALKAAGCLRGPAVGVPFADGRYAHPDGLCRLPEALHDEPAPPEGMPLRLLSLVQKRYLLSQIPQADQHGPVDVFLAPETLARLGFAHGQTALLKGERGEMRVTARERPGLAQDAVLLPRGGWLKCGRCANALTVGRECDLGGQAAYYDQWCRLERPSSKEET